MTPFFEKMLRFYVTIATVLGRVRERIELVFSSKKEVARRTVEKFETLHRKEMEAERIDRLVNPRDYQGK